MNIITVGIDLAKNVFAVHGINDNGKPVLSRTLQVAGRLTSLPQASGHEFGWRT